MSMNFQLPDRLVMANIPTRIERLERLSAELGISLYLKRDDQTGMEWSGNKVRKLEFTVKQAMNLGCDYLITCGGSQSNHCRATAAVAARTGLKSCLLLRGNEQSVSEGNLFLDKLLGAEVRFISPEDYAVRRNELMQEIAAEKEKEGHKAYIIPEGASNGIGSFGYCMAYQEIMQQESDMNVYFDTIAFAVGSGGTYAGMLLGNKLQGSSTRLAGYLVGGSISYFQDTIQSIFKEFSPYLHSDIHPSSEDLNLIDSYIGAGYGLNTGGELQFITDLARLEGVVLDNVYTGKAMYGLVSDIKRGKYAGTKNILFIHTGGLFELFSQTRQFRF